MTVSESDIPIVSMGRYSVDSSGNFTGDMFTSYKAVAEARVLLDAPALAGVLADRAVALLICHFIETGKGLTHTKSINAGSAQASYDDSGSSFMKEYREIITGAQKTDTEASATATAKAKGGIRADASWQGI